MSTVLRLDGLRVVIYPNDHRPAHVHVIGGGCEAVFNLHCPDGPVEVRENFSFSRQQVRRLTAALAEQLSELCESWEQINGRI
jgi:hypothetical protein